MADTIVNIDTSRLERELKRQNDLKALELRMKLDELRHDYKLENKEYRSLSKRLDSLK